MSDSSGRILCCSDIHGHLQAFRRVLFAAQWRPARDTLILLGDYIDRGPRPREMVNELRVLLRCPGVVALRGNHEVMLWSYLNGSLALQQYLDNGGGTTLKAYGGDDSLLWTDAEFLAHLPVFHETDDYVFVHAGLRPGVPLHRQDDGEMVWIRDEFIRSYRGKTVVFGHSPTTALTGGTEVYWGRDKIGIDTGVAYGGCLTLLELPGGETYQAPPDM